MSTQRSDLSQSISDNVPDPEEPIITRRTAIARAIALPLVAVLPAGLGGCARAPKCDDISGLSPEDAKVRTEAAAYTEVSMDPTKHCKDCAQYVGPPSGGCGTCKVVKGPINPGGSCKLFAPKQP